jgi:hypothetical protein
LELKETLQGTDKYVSERGTEFEIIGLVNGLYSVKMLKGGAVPPICNSSFTSYRRAKEALEEYIRGTDRNGYAEYPSKKEKTK